VATQTVSKFSDPMKTSATGNVQVYREIQSAGQL